MGDLGGCLTGLAAAEVRLLAQAAGLALLFVVVGLCMLDRLIRTDDSDTCNVR